MYPLSRGMCDAQNRSGRFGEDKNLLLLPEEQIANKISHYEQRKSSRNFLCVALMLWEASCARAVIGISYSNAGDTVATQARET